MRYNNNNYNNDQSQTLQETDNSRSFCIADHVFYVNPGQECLLNTNAAITVLRITKFDKSQNSTDSAQHS